MNHQQYFLLLFGLDCLEQKFKKREGELGNLETTVTEYLQNNPILGKKKTPLIGIAHFILSALQMGKRKVDPTEGLVLGDTGNEGVRPRTPLVYRKALTHSPGLVG